MDRINTTFFNYNNPLPSLLSEENIPGNLNEAYTVYTLAEIHDNHEDFRSAIHFYRSALVKFRQSDNKLGEANVISRLGMIHDKLADPGGAIALYEKALFISHQIGDIKHETAIIDNLGVILTKIGVLGKAAILFKRQVNIAQGRLDCIGEANAFQCLGTVFLSGGKYKQALRLYERALYIFRKVVCRQAEGATLFNMALASKSLNMKSKARAYLEGALRIFEEIGDPRAKEAQKELARQTGFRSVFKSVGALIKKLKFVLIPGWFTAFATKEYTPGS